jgi:hypothetical protein
MNLRGENQNEQIKRMMERAFDSAFQQQLGGLYKTFIANVTGGVKDQKEYTKTGIENAIAAYRLAMEAVENWSPK